MNSACNVHNPAVFSRCIFISRWFGKAITSSARPVIANPADRPTARGRTAGLPRNQTVLKEKLAPWRAGGQTCQAIPCS